MEIGRISILFETLLHLQQWNCCFKGGTDFNSSHCLKFCITLIKTYKITTTSKYLILWYKSFIAGQDRIILLPFSYHRLRMQYHLYLSGARSNPDNCVLLLPLYFQIDIYLTNNLFVSEWWQEDWGKYYFWMGKKGNLWWHFLICHASDGWYWFPVRRDSFPFILRSNK